MIQLITTAQKMKFSIKVFFKNVTKESLMENFIFGAVKVNCVAVILPNLKLKLTYMKSLKMINDQNTGTCTGLGIIIKQVIIYSRGNYIT